MRFAHFSPSNLSIKHRLPLLIGALLLLIIVASTWASYRGVKESALEVGNQRLLNLTKQLSNLLQQSSVATLRQTFAVANDPAIRAVLQSPSPNTRSTASATLEQLQAPKDPLGFQVELWDLKRSLVLSKPDGALPVAADLETEFKASGVAPFMSVGPMHPDKNIILAPGIAAVKDELGNPLGYLVRWRRVSLNPQPKQLTELIGSDAALYFGNSRGDIFTNLERIVAKPQSNVGSTLDIMHYSRDGNSVMAHARPIGGTPWFVLVEFPEQPFMTQANRFLRRMVIIGAVLLALGIAGAVLLSRNITKPLEALTDAASAIGAGDYSHAVNVRREDELGTLANVFNIMVGKMRDSHRELEQKVRDRTAQLEAAAGALLMIDAEGLISSANEKAEILFGYDRGDLLGQPVKMLIPERFRATYSGHRINFFHSPSTRSMGVDRDFFGRRKDGSEVPIEIGLNPIKTDQGAFVLASIMDITERKRADERFRLVVEAAPSAMIMVNEKGLISLVNTQTERLFGYTRTELLGKPMEILVPERFRAAHPAVRDGFFEHPSARAMGAGRDLFGLRKDGVEVPIEIGLNPIRTDEGPFVLASIIDITERKGAEEGLRKSEERLHTIIENLSEGLVLSDLDGQLLHWNQPGLDMFGFSSMKEALLKLPEFEKLLELSTLDGRVLKLEEWPLARILAGDHLSNYELVLRRLDKDWSRIFSYGGTIVKEPTGGALAFVTITDITESKQAEEKLRRSREQLAGVIGSARDAIISIDEQQRIVLFNNAAERMFLFPAEDAIGQPLDRFIPERFRAAHHLRVEGFGETPATGRSTGGLGARYGLRADGEEFPLEASISQIDSDGLKLSTFILRDTSERTRAEEVLREQTRILDLAPILIRDLSDRIVLWNTGAEQMFGWTADEALDKISHTLLHTQYPRPLEEIKARVLAHGHWEGELVHVRKNGERIVVATRWVLHRDKQGQPKAILAVNNDVTEHRRMEEAERSSELRYRRLFESAKDGILILDGDTGHIVDVNPYLIQLLGFSKEEFLGKELWQLGFFEDIDASKLAFTELKARGYIRYDDLPLKNRDGLLMRVEFVSNSYMAGASRVIQCNIRDITERMRAEEKIRRLNEELEERIAERTAELRTANKELEAFSYSVSHDLRAPLRHINGFSQALLEDCEERLDETGKGYLREVRGASREMAQLIDDVLQLARITRSEMKREEINLSELARSVIAELKKANGRQGVSVKIEEGLVTRGDKRLLRVVLSNLLGNAWKFTSKRDNPEILFGSEQKNGEVFYFVRDNGAGFDMAYVKKLFGAFQRLHTAGEFEGTGIGLATVQRIINRHGGRVWAEGSVNAGATFCFTLPGSKEIVEGKQSDPTG
jgi:PAS domain S-box-containing protein